MQRQPKPLPGTLPDPRVPLPDSGSTEPIRPTLPPGEMAVLVGPVTSVMNANVTTELDGDNILTTLRLPLRTIRTNFEMFVYEYRKRRYIAIRETKQIYDETGVETSPNSAAYAAIASAVGEISEPLNPATGDIENNTNVKEDEGIFGQITGFLRGAGIWAVIAIFGGLGILVIALNAKTDILGKVIGNAKGR